MFNLSLSTSFYVIFIEGLSSFIMRFMVAGFKQNYMKWGRSDNKRDIFWSGNADDGVVKISELLGWKVSAIFHFVY